MSTGIQRNRTLKPDIPNSGPVGRPLTRIRHTIQARRDRAQLANLSPEMLRDIGLTREAAVKESLREYLDMPNDRFR